MFISKYETFFQNRLFMNLPCSAFGTLISNIDFIIADYQTKKFMMIELKTRGNQMKKRQKDLYNLIHKRLRKGNSGVDDRTFVGTYLISLEGDNFKDGKCYIQGTNILRHEIDEETLKNTLYMLIN